MYAAFLKSWMITGPLRSEAKFICIIQDVCISQHAKRVDLGWEESETNSARSREFAGPLDTGVLDPLRQATFP